MMHHIQVMITNDYRDGNASGICDDYGARF